MHPIAEITKMHHNALFFFFWWGRQGLTHAVLKFKIFLPQAPYIYIYIFFFLIVSEAGDVA
jgi:uncharacterized membrane protein YpjA